MDKKRFKISYLFVLPFILILGPIAVGAAACCGYFMLVAYSAKLWKIFWLIVAAGIMLILWSIILQCISVWFPKNKGKKGTQQSKQQTKQKQTIQSPKAQSVQAPKQQTNQRSVRQYQQTPSQNRNANASRPSRKANQKYNNNRYA